MHYMGDLTEKATCNGHGDPECEEAPSETA